MKKEKLVKTDLTKQYLINLCIVGEAYTTVNVVCNVSAHDGVIIATAAENPELFETHRFVDDFFQWQLYRGVIKVYNKEAIENNNKP